MQISAPRLLIEDDVSGHFDCGVQQLNEWFANQAWRNQKNGDSRTYVSTDVATGSVTGFYSLYARSLARDRIKGRLARNAPNPIPVILLGQLAVSVNAKGKGLGGSLFVDAVKRSQAAAEIIGARATITEAIDNSAKAFYVHLGMTLLPDTENMLCLLLR